MGRGKGGAEVEVRAIENRFRPRILNGPVQSITNLAGADEQPMNVIVDYLLMRPLSGCIHGVMIGVLLPLTLASLISLKAGRVWAILLAPLWLALMVITVPVGVIYSFWMTMVKGPLWHYPPHQRSY
jgi:hypothetical protein